MHNTKVIQQKQMTGDFYMKIEFNTKSFTVDEQNNNKIEKIKNICLLKIRRKQAYLML